MLAAQLQYRGMGQALGFLLAWVSGEVWGTGQASPDIRSYPKTPPTAAGELTGA